MVTEEERLARAALVRLAEPGDKELGRLIREIGPVATVGLIRSGTALPASPGGAPATERVWRWRARLPSADAEGDLAASERLGARLVCPGEPEWPTQLDDLADARPVALWVRGAADLRYRCLSSVAVIGSRAATAYGAHVAAELAIGLAERGWTVLSGGAFGIDGAAHRGALAGGGPTVVVLACGVDVPYPRGHDSLFQEVMRTGVLVSEWPPGATPTRTGFLVRNRVIAALTRGTVVVEAAVRSGALSTARSAHGLGRALMAVPGPVTSRVSAGCHLLLREWDALCVTDADEVIDRVGAIGDDLAARRRGPVRPRDLLGRTERDVLEAVPAGGGAGPAAVAVAAAVDLDTAIRCLGALAAAGFVERCERGWRLARG